MRNEYYNLNQLQKSFEKSSDSDLISIISNGFISNLHKNLNNSFDDIDDKLFKMAENSSSNNNQNLYFSAINNIRNNKEVLVNNITESLAGIFESCRKKRFSYSDSLCVYHKKTSELELIDETELDESLTISNLINKSNTAYQKQLHELKIRFSKLVSINEMQLEQLPLSPFVLVNTYANCLKSLELYSDVKLIIYKIFERSVMGNLNANYSAINAFLIENNIIPKIDYSFQQQRKEKNSKVDTKSEALNNKTRKHINNHATPTMNNNKKSSRVNQAYGNEQSLDYNYQSIIQSLRTCRASSNYSTSVSDEQVQQYDIRPTKNDFDSFKQHLSHLQSKFIQRKRLSEKLPISPIEISQTILEQFYELNHKQNISQKNEDMIDLIGLLFQFIIDNNNLPDKIQIILSKLQIPFLKVALKDGNLFANKNHEARVLLNSLAKASLGWTEKSDANGKFIAKISEITQHILEIEHLSPKVFELLQMNFDNFLRKSNKKFRINQERTKKTTLAHEKIIKAKEASARLLMTKIESNTTSHNIRNLLIMDWFNVLNLMYLRYSKGSIELNEKMNFVDNLINFTQVGYVGNKKGVEDIVENYRAGLKMVAFNPKEMNDKIDYLKGLLNAHCDETILLEPKKDSVSNIFNLQDVRNKRIELLNVIDGCVRDNKRDKKYNQNKDKYYRKAKQLKIGTWLNFRNLAKYSIRARLSWISPLSQKYLFVNSKGVKITHKSCLELADGFRNKSIFKIDNTIIFDQALFAISKKLQNNKNITDLKNIKF